MLLLKIFVCSVIASALSSLANQVVKTFFKFFETKSCHVNSSSISELELVQFEKKLVQDISDNFPLYSGAFPVDEIVLSYRRHVYRDYFSNVGRIFFSFEQEESGEESEGIYDWNMFGSRYFMCFSDGSIAQVPYTLRTEILEQKSLTTSGIAIYDFLLDLPRNRRNELICAIEVKLNILGSVCEVDQGVLIPDESCLSHGFVEFTFYPNFLN